MHGNPARLSVQTGRGETPPSPAADARAPPATACRTRSPCPRRPSPSRTRTLPTPSCKASVDRAGGGEEMREMREGGRERVSERYCREKIFWAVGLFKLRRWLVSSHQLLGNRVPVQDQREAWWRRRRRRHFTDGRMAQLGVFGCACEGDASLVSAVGTQVQAAVDVTATASCPTLSRSRFLHDWKEPPVTTEEVELREGGVGRRLGLYLASV